MSEVVVAGESEGGNEKKVMVAIDESEYSYYALIWALDNLKESISKFPLIIFVAQPPTEYNYSFAALLGSALLYLPVIAEAKDIFAGRGVKAKIVTEVGDPKTAICSAVQKLNINLLILGEHGLGKTKRVLIGSVSNYCVQNAKCLVLVVKKS